MLRKIRKTMMNCKNIEIMIMSFLLFAVTTQAQEVEYGYFMRQVAEKNAGYLAEKYNVEVAVANAQAAKVFNDPELSFTYSNNQDWNLQMGQGFETGISYTMSLGNVRGARMKVSNKELQIAEATAADYLLNLKAEAAAAYAEAWCAAAKEKIMYDAYVNMCKIAYGDSTRLSIGDVNATDAMQSAMEAKRMKNEWLSSVSDSKNAYTRLSLFAGGLPVEKVQDELPFPFSDADKTLSELQSLAIENRCDLRVAIISKQLSEANLKLVQASRSMEISLNAGYSYNTKVRNEIAPAPKYHGFSVGVSIPLKFSSTNKGEVAAAKAAILQNEKNQEAAMSQISTEVAMAFESYKTSEVILDTYNSSVIGDAETILEHRTFGYKSGESRLIDLLEAQRAYDDVMISYVEAKRDVFISCAELCRTVGL